MSPLFINQLCPLAEETNNRRSVVPDAGQGLSRAPKRIEHPSGIDTGCMRLYSQNERSHIESLFTLCAYSKRAYKTSSAFGFLSVPGSPAQGSMGYNITPSTLEIQSRRPYDRVRRARSRHSLKLELISTEWRIRIALRRLPLSRLSVRFVPLPLRLPQNSHAPQFPLLWRDRCRGPEEPMCPDHLHSGCTC